MYFHGFEYTYKFYVVLQTNRSVNQQSQIDFSHFTPPQQLSATMRALSPMTPAGPVAETAEKLPLAQCVFYRATGSLPLRHRTGRNRRWSEVVNESFSAVWNPKILEIQGHLIIYNHLHILSEIWKKDNWFLRGWVRARNLKQWYLKMTFKLLSHMLLQHPIPLQKE